MISDDEVFAHTLSLQKHPALLICRYLVHSAWHSPALKDKDGKAVGRVGNYL